jgi:uncharacterized membrane protein YfcA
MWDVYFYLLIGLLVFFGFTVRVITGFGSTMILAPIIALFLEPKHTVVFVILLESAMGVLFIVKEKLSFDVKPIFVGGFFGIIAGIVLFGLLSQRLVGLIIGISVLTFSVLFLLNITGINGPQIVLGLANQGYDGNFIRQCMITYLILIDFVTLASFSISGYVTANVLRLLVYSIPFLICSYVVGTHVLRFINPEKLKRLMLITTLFAGLLAIWNFIP